MRKTLLALFAVLALALGACGASGGNDDASDDETTTTAGSEETTTTEEGTDDTEPETTTTTEDEGSGGDGVEVEEWATEFCGNFETWQSDIKAAADDIQNQVTPGDMESAKSAIVGMLETASDETQELIGELESGGAPDIDEGDDFLDDLVSRFEGFDDAILSVRDDVEGLSAADPTTFQTEVTTLLTTFQTEVTEIGESFEELDQEYGSAELDAALNSACDL